MFGIIPTGIVVILSIFYIFRKREKYLNSASLSRENAERRVLMKLAVRYLIFGVLFIIGFSILVFEIFYGIVFAR